MLGSLHCMISGNKPHCLRGGVQGVRMLRGGSVGRKNTRPANLQSDTRSAESRTPELRRGFSATCWGRKIRDGRARARNVAPELFCAVRWRNIADSQFPDLRISLSQKTNPHREGLPPRSPPGFLKTKHWIFLDDVDIRKWRDDFAYLKRTMR